MKALMGLAAGLVAAVATMIVVGFAGSLLFPISGPGDREALLATLGTASAASQAVILVAWTAAAFVGAAAAKRVARASWPGWTIAGGLAVVLAGAFLMPLPDWMQIAAVVGPLAGGLLADMLVSGAPRREVEPAADA